MIIDNIRKRYSVYKDSPFGKFAKRIKDDNITACSAHAAFFLFISTFPFLIILMTLIKYTPLTKDMLYSMLNSDAPNFITDTLKNWIDEIYGETRTVLSLSILGALWASSKGFVGIADNINKIFHHNINLNYFFHKLLGLLYTIIFLAVTMATMVLILFGRKISSWLLNTISISSDILIKITDLRIYIAIGVFMIVILAIYILIPHRKTKIRNELPGAIFTTAGWILFSAGYSVYIENIGLNRSIYGSLTSLIFFMLWLYCCIYILFLGAELNLFLYKRHKAVSIQ